MNKIKVIVDSTMDLTKEYLKENDILVLPLGVTFGEEVYKDGVTITVDELYSKVKETNKLPKTSAISTQELYDAFKTYLDQGYDIFYTGISSKLSSSYNNACVARDELDPSRILVFDSCNLSTGIGLQVCKAVEMIKQGFNLKQIEEKLIIRVIDGGMKVFKKPIGKTIKACNALLDIFKKDLENMDTSLVMITSTAAPTSEKYLYDEVKKYIKEENIMVTHAGSVISSHCGPGTIGILYIMKQ